MDPPAQLQNVFLGYNNNNDYTISFKAFLNKTTNVVNELSKDTFLSYVLDYCDNIKYSLDTQNKKLIINDIKVLNIISNSALSKKSKSTNDTIEFGMNYDSTYTASSNKLVINGTMKVKKNNIFMCDINNLVIMVEIHTDKIQKKQYLQFKLSYTNSAEDINSFQKKNIAHSIRTLIIPFKLAIE